MKMRFRGAVIAWNNQVIARAHNLTETLNDVTAHAEMQAFTAAANTSGGKYLTNCTLYVTLEPCVMCAGASNWIQIDRIVYGADDEKRGFTLLKESRASYPDHGNKRCFKKRMQQPAERIF